MADFAQYVHLQFEVVRRLLRQARLQFFIDVFRGIPHTGGDWVEQFIQKEGMLSNPGTDPRAGTDKLE